MVFLFLVEVARAACTVTDAAGQAIHLDKPASRIITLAPDITEIVFAIGAGKHVIGVVAGSDYPPAVKRIPQVGSYTGLDLERIVAMHPDLIVTWDDTFARQLKVLKKFHIPVYTTKPHHLEDIPQTMQQLGCLTATETSANRVAETYLRRLADLKQRYHTQHPRRVFYQIGTYGLLTINKDSWINQAIALCGGRNVFGHLKMITPEVSWEAVVMANPEVILSDTASSAWKERWQRFPTIIAVKRQAMYAIPADLIDRAGPRLIMGVAQMCKVIN